MALQAVTPEEDRPRLFVVPGSERIEPYYRIVTDEMDNHCETVLVAAVRNQPFPRGAFPLVPPRLTKAGHWFGLFRCPKDYFCQQR